VYETFSISKRDQRIIGEKRQAVARMRHNQTNKKHREQVSPKVERAFFQTALLVRWSAGSGSIADRSGMRRMRCRKMHDFYRLPVMPAIESKHG
jgi:hypothetical protein